MRALASCPALRVAAVIALLFACRGNNPYIDSDNSCPFKRGIIISEMIFADNSSCFSKEEMLQYAHAVVTVTIGERDPGGCVLHKRMIQDRDTPCVKKEIEVNCPRNVRFEGRGYFIEGPGEPSAETVYGTLYTPTCTASFTYISRVWTAKGPLPVDGGGGQ